MFVPDKRYTFDVLRSISTIKDIEDAHLAHLRHPSRSMVEAVYFNCDFKAEASVLWRNSYEAMPTHTTDQAQKITEKLDLSGADVHCYIFTLESFKVHPANEYLE